MGALENRVRAAVLSGRRKGSARPPEPVAGVRDLRNRARSADNRAFPAERTFAIRVLRINHRSRQAGWPFFLKKIRKRAVVIAATARPGRGEFLSQDNREGCRADPLRVTRCAA